MYSSLHQHVGRGGSRKKKKKEWLTKHYFYAVLVTKQCFVSHLILPDCLAELNGLSIQSLSNHPWEGLLMTPEPVCLRGLANPDDQAH